MSEAICKKQKIRFLLGILVEADFFAGICLVFFCFSWIIHLFGPQ